MASPHRVGVIGASGYTGAELLRLLAGHPDLRLEVATGDTQAGNRVADLYPSLAAAYGQRRYDAFSPEVVDGLDLVFVALPHGASQAVVADLPVPVAPSSTTSRCPSPSLRASSSIAWGWSPAGSYSLTTVKSAVARSISPMGRNSECATTGCSAAKAIPQG